jgi:hypothetical protein
VILIRSALPLRKAEDLDSASRFDIALDFHGRFCESLETSAAARLHVRLGFHGVLLSVTVLDPRFQRVCHPASDR